ncbi:MAG: serine hydrolase [Actinobacteria bacterium]|nr:serine hydrolase [Actinomycetota bacterium]
MNTPISGLCDERFGAVRQAFADNFAERGEVGAAVCVLVNGEPVVDLVGGFADEACTQRWQPDTLVNFYSVGKAIVALLALQLVDAGLISLDDPIASIWPEFGVGGKQTATIRHALCHRAGVPAIREMLTNDDLSDWSRMTSAVAATDAWWEPGSRHTYHTNTYGHLVGEIVRRVSGEMPGVRLRRLADAIGADVWFGVPEAEQPRCAEVIWAPGRPIGDVDFSQMSGEGLMIALGYFNPSGYSSGGIVNTPEWRSAQVPSTNGHGSAAGVARLYSALISDAPLLSPALLAEATRSQSEGFCPVLGEEAVFGLGFKPTSARRPFGPNPRSFGHFGTGGALGFADPDTGVAFGYVMNHVIPRWQSTRNRSLIEAVFSSI